MVDEISLNIVGLRWEGAWRVCGNQNQITVIREIFVLSRFLQKSCWISQHIVIKIQPLWEIVLCFRVYSKKYTNWDLEICGTDFASHFSNSSFFLSTFLFFSNNHVKNSKMCEMFQFVAYSLYAMNGEISGPFRSMRSSNKCKCQ